MKSSSGTSDAAKLILALDLATRTGFARGRIGEQPMCGSIRLAGKGASHGAIGSGLVRWLGEELAKERPDILVLEAPLPAFAKRGMRNANADRILSGLCFLAEAVAHCRGIYDVREASSSAVRSYFVGSVHCTREQAKSWTITRCKSLGWLESADDDAADACALWSYQCSLIDPLEGIRTAPLFGTKLSTSVSAS